MKKKSLSLICIAMAILLLSGCSLFDIGSEKGDLGKRGSQSNAKDDFDDPAYLNEQDGAEIITVQHPEEDYVGKWSAGSDYSEYLYGKVILTINENHTWTGSITDEKFSGVWVYEIDKINIKDSEGVIDWNLFFVSDGNLMFQNKKNTDVSLVLKPAD